MPSARFSGQNIHPRLLSFCLTLYTQVICKPCKFYFVTYLEPVHFKCIILIYCWEGWMCEWAEGTVCVKVQWQRKLSSSANLSVVGAVPWQSRGYDSTLSLSRAWVQSLVGELRSQKLHPPKNIFLSSEKIKCGWNKSVQERGVVRNQIGKAGPCLSNAKPLH